MVYVQRQHWQTWTGERDVAGLWHGVWLDLVDAFVEKKCTMVWTKNMLLSVQRGSSNGAYTQKKIASVGWTNDTKCQKCDGEGSEWHLLDECKYWDHIRRQMPEEGRKFEQLAKTTLEGKTLWDGGIVGCPHDIGEEKRLERMKVPRWDRMPCTLEGKIAVDGSFRGFWLDKMLRVVGWMCSLRLTKVTFRGMGCLVRFPLSSMCSEP